jgi:uncharacterized protein (DUF697 family)
LPLGVLKDIRKIYSGLNAGGIRADAAQSLRIGLVATSENVYRDMEDFLVPPGINGNARGQALGMVVRLDQPKFDQTRKDFDILLCEAGVGIPRNGYLFDAGGSDGALIDAIVTENQDIELALARSFPVFRHSVAHQIISRVSKENAMLALVTALPNVLPSFIDLPWAVGEFATDTAFLTMNQIRMALMMAAVYDRPVGYSEQKTSIAAIAGGAFGWRAIARELVGKIPLGGGLIPKAAIAYAGTWVVGTGLNKLYSTGVGHTHSEKREAWSHAMTRGRDIAAELRP